MITNDHLKAIVPGIKPANLEIYVPLLNIYMAEYEINTPARITQFLANLAHESGSFNFTKEIASGAGYEGRTDLGNTEPGDGRRFPGRGLIQITGRAMYAWLSQALYGDDRLVKNPSLLEEPVAATKSACWFWAIAKKLNEVADLPETWTKIFRKKEYTRFQWIVLRINGGQNGLADRNAFYERAKKVIF